MTVAAAVLLGGAVLLAGVIDRRVLVAAITASIASNASAVLAVEHSLPDYLLPLAGLGLATVAWDRLRRPHRPSYPDRVPAHWVGAGLVALAVLVATAGPFVSDHPADSAAQVMVLAKALLVVVALALLVEDRPTFRAALVGLMVGGVAVAVVTDVQLLLGLQQQTFGGFGSWSTQQLAGAGDVARAAGPFGDDPNSYAQHLAVATGATVGLAATVGRRGPARWLLWSACGVLLVAMLATSSRTGLLALAAIAVVALVFWPPSRAGLLAIAGAATVVLLGPFSVVERLGTLGQVDAIGTTGADTSLTGRASEALAAVRLFAEHPIAGVGYGAYPPEYLQTARPIGFETRLEPRSAHSLPLEIAAEQGLLGLVAWTALLLFAIWVARRLRRRFPAEGSAFALALVGFGVTAVFLHDVHPRVMWALVAMSVGGARLLESLVRPPAAAPDGPVVAMVIQNYVPALGGAERQLASLMPRFVERGIRPVVVTRALEGRPTRDEVDGVPVIRIPDRGPKALRSLAFVVGARRELRAIRPDVIHAFDTLTPSVIALGHRRAHGTPVLVKLLRSGEIGDLEVLGRKTLGERRVRSLVRGVDRFVAISTDLVAELRDRGVTDDRILQIPNGVDTERFHPAADADGQDPHPPRVIATGRLAPEKRLRDVAERWADVRRHHPTAELVLVGDGPDRAAIDGVPGTRLLGRRDDVPDLLRTADLYVSASNAEGLSNSLLEAMASGLPSVVTDVGGVRDVMVHGVHGIVVDPDDLDGLMSRITLLLDAPERRIVLGQAARSRVETGWSLDATADALTDAYRNLSAATASRRPIDAAAATEQPGPTSDAMHVRPDDRSGAAPVVTAP